MKEYTQQEMWDVYEKLPEELQEAIWSPDTAKHIRNACKRSDVDKDKIPTVATLTGRVLMGLLTPKEFKVNLQKDAGLSEKAAQNVFQELNRFVFMPVRETLSALYGIEIEPTKKAKEFEERGEAGPQDEGQEKKASEDKYREPIE